MMKIIDLTHTITPKMPVYPGTKPPVLQDAGTYERDGFRETFLSMYSHTGTHMDAPAHLFADRTQLDGFPVSQFIGKGLVIDCSDVCQGVEISMKKIEAVKESADQADFLLFHTGWSRFWGKDIYFGEYPVISSEICDYVIGTEKKGIGLDVIGVDPIADEGFTRHRLLLRHEIVIIENLTNLSELGSDLFTFAALPLKYQNADGAPVRAIGILNE